MSERKDGRTAIVMALAAALSWLPAGEAAELGGRPFTSPGEVTPMPDDWRNRPVDRGATASADVALAIDQQLYPALLPLIGGFAKARGLKVAMQEGTCGIASDALASKTADITGMCCPPGPFDRLPGARYHAIGIAAVALIVHPSNPIEDVDLATARRLFGDEVGLWSDLPVGGVRRGPSQPVRAVVRLHCAVRPGHWRLLLDNADLFSADAFEVPAITDMLAEVARNPQAIGYETLWHIADKAAAGAVKVLKIGGVAPTDATALAEGRYPLYRVFSITTWDGPAANPAARDLAAHLVGGAPGIDPAFGIVPVQRLRAAGWVFVDDEIVGEPR